MKSTLGFMPVVPTWILGTLTGSDLLRRHGAVDLPESKIRRCIGNTVYVEPVPTEIYEGRS